MSFVASRPAWQRLPWLLILAAGALLVLGLSGMQRAARMQGGASLADRQVRWALLGLVAGTVCTIIPYRRIGAQSYGLFALSLPLLVVVLLMPPRNGARCWIPLGWFDFQPSEMVKITLILALGHYLRYRENFRRVTGLIPPFIMTCIPLLLILKEPDLGSAMVFLPVLVAMLFAAGARLKHLFCALLLAVSCLPAFWLGMNAEQRSRITALFSQQDGGPNPRGDRYHQHQSKLVLSLGGFWGSEAGETTIDDPAAYHLPAGQTDFIFCWVGERWGLLGGLATLGLYAVLFASGLSVAASTREPFGRLVATGLMTVLATQTLMNTGMTVGLLPVAGITLPLMSYGGSSLLFTCVALGLVINIGVRPGYEVTGEPFRFREGDRRPR